MPETRCRLVDLVAVLNDAEFNVVESGDDRYPEMATFRPPAEPARFFARIHERGDMLEALGRLADVVWPAFGRGCVEFRGWLEVIPKAKYDTPDDTDVVVIEITQILDVPNA